jgi:hypothetical protein
MPARRGLSVCVPVGNRAGVEIRRYDHRTPILTLRAARAALVTLTLPDRIEAGHVEFARQLARLAALREHPEILPALAVWIAENQPALGDLGYEGEADSITVAFKKPRDGQLTDEQKTHSQGPQRKTRHRRTRELAAEDDLQSPAQHQPLPLAQRQDRRCRPRPAPHRPRPHHVITHGDRSLPGKVVACLRA